MKNLNITLIQSSLFWEDVEMNLSHFDKLISEIKETDIILLPEMFNTSLKERALIASIIEENLKVTKDSGLPYF